MKIHQSDFDINYVILDYPFLVDSTESVEQTEENSNKGFNMNQDDFNKMDIVTAEIVLGDYVNSDCSPVKVRVYRGKDGYAYQVDFTNKRFRKAVIKDSGGYGAWVDFQ